MSDQTPEQPNKQRRSEAFFGRRKAKRLSPKQNKRFAELFPKLKIDVSADPVKSISKLFDQSCDEYVLEIGFGGGEHLIHQAQSNEKTGFIGVEPFVNSMAKALSSIDESGIENTRLYDEDAVELLDWLPASCLDRVDLLYPDPWPKPRHWKRRFVNQKNLDRIARVLKSDGVFHFASDIDTYVNWTLHHCERHSAFEWSAAEANDWHAPYDNWIRTRYEAKAIREGRTPCYLRFNRNQP